MCCAARSHPSRLCQSIHRADRAVCSHHHRKTRVTRSSSLAMGPSSLEQLRAASGTRLHPPPTSVLPLSHTNAWQTWVRPLTARVWWQERSIRDLLGGPTIQSDHPNKLAVFRMRESGGVSASAPLACCGAHSDARNDGRGAPHGRSDVFASSLGPERPGTFSRHIVPSPRPMAPSVDGIGPCITCTEHVVILQK